jgi:hypothetical protein
MKGVQREAMPPTCPPPDHGLLSSESLPRLQQPHHTQASLTCLLRGVAPSSSRSVSTMPGDRLCTRTGACAAPGRADASVCSVRSSCAMAALVAP